MRSSNVRSRCFLWQWAIWTGSWRSEPSHDNNCSSSLSPLCWSPPSFANVTHFLSTCFAHIPTTQCFHKKSGWVKIFFFLGLFKIVIRSRARVTDLPQPLNEIIVDITYVFDSLILSYHWNTDCFLRRYLTYLNKNSSSYYLRRPAPDILSQNLIVVLILLWMNFD